MVTVQNRDAQALIDILGPADTPVNRAAADNPMTALLRMNISIETQDENWPYAEGTLTAPLVE